MRGTLRSAVLSTFIAIAALPATTEAASVWTSIFGGGYNDCVKETLQIEDIWARNEARNFCVVEHQQPLPKSALNALNDGTGRFTTTGRQPRFVVDLTNNNADWRVSEVRIRITIAGVGSTEYRARPLLMIEPYEVGSVRFDVNPPPR